jgi:trk system potassium uptake protein TrkH
MRDFLPVLRVLGVLLALFSAVMILPGFVSWAHADGLAWLYPLTAGLTLACGLALWLGLRKHRGELHPRDGVVLVSLTWVLLPLFASLPLLAAFHQLGHPIGFTHAYFEAVSGLTTAGGTVLAGVDRLPISVNFWRTLLQWVGGMGVLVLAVAVLPLLGVGGSQLFKAEVAGPIKETRLTPRVAETAKGLWGVYAVLSLGCALAYWAGGMSPMDAVMHMFSTVSLGGLSSYDASFGHFQSPLLEAIAIGFMLVASCNFALYFVAVRKGHLRGTWRDPELRATLSVLVGGGLLVALLLWAKGIYAPLQALRHGMFHVVSVGTTTGYATVDYLLWPAFAPIFMLLLSGVATSAGSTGGGIMMVRMLIAGTPRNEPAGAPARGSAGDARHDRGGPPRDLLGTGLHAGIRRHGDRAEHGAAADRHGPRHRLQCRHRQPELHGAGARRGRPGVQFLYAEQLPAVGLYAGDGAGAPGDAELHRFADPILLEAVVQLAKPGAALNSLQFPVALLSGPLSWFPTSSPP